MANHIVVGLGGTGGRVLAALRRRLCEHPSPNDSPSLLDDPELLVDYLYVDSKESDCEHARQSTDEQAPTSMWRTQGRSVGLAPRQVLKLETGNFLSVLSHPRDFSNVTDWLGDLNTWSAIWNSTPNGVVAGGQMRRFGRYLFASNVARFDQAFKDSMLAVRKRGVSQVSAQERVTVHLICGLAGGTGSGTFMDAICRIRALTHDASLTRILLYVVPPELEQTPWATHTYYANGYAALLEINGLLVQKFKPYDVSGGGQVIDAVPPVDNVFVITNRNQNGDLLDVGTVVPEVIAETLFQTVVLSGDARDADPASSSNAVKQNDDEWRAALAGENLNMPYETDFEARSGDAPAPDVRANRFLTFGLKRIAIPVEEIREVLNLTFIQSALTQMRFNFWRDGHGYSDRSLIANTRRRSMADKEDAWCLSGAQLRLDRPSLPDDPPATAWKPPGRVFAEQITTVIQEESAARDPNNRNARKDRPGYFKKLLLAIGLSKQPEAEKKKHPLKSMQSKAEFVYEEAFRGQEGVDEFFRIQSKEIRSRSMQIRRQIEIDLFSEWHTGKAGVGETTMAIEGILDILRRKTRLLEKEDKNLALVIGESRKAMESAYEDYENSTTGFGGLLSRPAREVRIIEQFGDELARFCTSRARTRGVKFAVKLLASVEADLQRLRADVAGVASILNDAIDQCSTTISAIDLFELEAVRRNYLERFFDTARTREVVASLKVDKGNQERASASLRNFIADRLLDGESSFGLFGSKLTAAKLVSDLQGPAKIAVNEAHETIGDPQDKILNANILDRIFEKYAGREDELKRQMQGWVSKAGVLTKFDHTEKTRGQKPVDTKRSLVAFVPSSSTLSEDRQSIRKSVCQAIVDSFALGKAEIVETQDNSHEITIMSIENMFPLRVMDFVSGLRAHYEKLVNSATGDRIRLEMHLEEDGRELPPLHLQSSDERRGRVLVYWLIAEALGLIENYTSDRSGETLQRFERELPDGRTEMVIVGKSKAGSRATDVGDRETQLLINLVTSKLSELVVHDERESLQEKLRALQKTAFEDVGRDSTDTDYVELEQAMAKSMQLVANRGQVRTSVTKSLGV